MERTPVIIQQVKKSVMNIPEDKNLQSSINLYVAISIKNKKIVISIILKYSHFSILSITPFDLCLNACLSRFSLVAVIFSSLLLYLSHMILKSSFSIVLYSPFFYFIKLI